MEKRHKYYLNKNGEFIIENYHLAKPFSSFFPGIAGVWGIPMWAFYVNRGQAISSFGIRDKDHPIMEFQPANKAYYLTPSLGFRTFIKMRRKKGLTFYDAFHNGINSAAFDIDNRMVISSYGLKLSETNRTLGVGVDIEYFTVPNDNYGALARAVTIKNLSRQPKDLEVLDGIPQLIPYGLSNMFLKKLSRTIEAWMVVENLENDIPFLRLKQDPTDRAEVIPVKEGNFYLIFDKEGVIKPVVDPESIFGQTVDFNYPRTYLEKKNFAYPKEQLLRSKTPCCMGYAAVTLRQNESHTLYSLAGNMTSLQKLKENAKRIADKGYLIKKGLENKQLIEGLEADVFTNSSSGSFNFYCAQNFIDNLMRGGYPLSIRYKDKDVHIHVYTRKHGDLERDYNKYLIEPTHLSQGNGNFRDINQNRRCDVWLNPSIRKETVLYFFNLLQADGYNPLVIKPSRFIFNKDYAALKSFLSDDAVSALKTPLEGAFTPGELFSFIEQNNIKVCRQRQDFLGLILANSTEYEQAEHGEGFWTDHWHYCLDLLESYLSLYPEELKNILIDNCEFTFFDNSEYVKARCARYLLRDNRVYQFHSVAHNQDKFKLIRQRKEFAHILRAENGQGDIFRTTLVAKMLTVIANKFATLDPFGVGVEMEADKPNWYDSFNGLPGLLGSSTCETFELKRWLLFLQNKITALCLGDTHKILLPREVNELLLSLNAICEANPDDFAFWDRSHTVKEEYRQRTLMGFSGDKKDIGIKELNLIFKNFLKKIDSGLKKAYDEKKGLYHSYFINEVSAHEVIDRQHSLVKPLKFKQRPLPLFLEGMVHYLRVIDGRKEARDVFKAVRESELFDKKLKMYKVCASLEDTPEEVGRCHVFTPGWLENESIWLHMEYKYILELLKNGLYKEFFEDFKNVLIPFQPPERYGRSILENSSFLVSSAFPQNKLHGNGFVSRLSGSTAEFLHIWLIMCTGHRPFYIDEENKLCFELKPILPRWLFTKKSQNGFAKDTFAFKFLAKTTVVYYNPNRKHTFGEDAAKISRIRLKPFDGPQVTFDSAVIPAPHSYDVRNGKIECIDIVFA